MDPEDEKAGEKIRRKNLYREKEEESNEYESPPPSDRIDPEVQAKGDSSKYMPKKNLQIEVIDHPDANAQAEQLENGEGSAVETDPNQYSEQEEPDHRRGTENEEYEQHHNGVQQESYKSFGEPQPQEYTEGEYEEEEEEAEEQKQGTGLGLEGALNDFAMRKEDNTRKNQEEHHQSFEGQEYTEEVEQTEEDKIDDDLVERQQREAEELLEETKKTMQEDEQEEVSVEEEEDEVEEIAKMAKENRINEMNPEEEEEEDDDGENQATDGSKFELNYTVGRIEDGAAILISKDHNLIEIPLCLLPGEIGPGNILKFSVDRNTKAEQKRVNEILSIQKQILENPNFFEE